MHKLWILIFCVIPVLAQRVQQGEIPSTLQPWKDWVLYGHESGLAPTRYNQSDPKILATPSRLALDVREEGAMFSLTWVVFAPSWIDFPGDDRLWPQNVTVNGSPRALTRRNNRPSTFVQPGTYTAQGQWRWTKAPQSLRIPATTGLLDMTLNGERVVNPTRDQEGLVWLQMTSTEEDQEEDKLTIKVFRLFTDELPLLETLQVRLTISGRDREIKLGAPLLAGFVPLEIDSQIPARLENDGQLVIQASSGEWTLILHSRAPGSPTELPLHAIGEPWPSDELWSFKAVSNIRTVVPSGFDMVDPSRTDLPFEHENPCFQAVSGGKLVLEERSRGLSSPPPDQVTLSRQLWLDFDGGGLTFSDALSGSLNRQWRISFQKPFEVGRVILDDESKLITLQGEPLLPGVEAQQQNLNLLAEGRLPKPGQFPVTGLDLPVDSVSTTLHYPANWRLFAVFGPDHVSGDWLASWSIWSFFWVFLWSAIVSKLWDRRAGLGALLTLVLLHQEPEAPSLIWLGILLAIALHRVSRNQVHVWIGRLRNVLTVILVLICLQFIRLQILSVLYPFENAYFNEETLYTDQLARMPAAAPAEAGVPEADRALVQKSFSEENVQNLVAVAPSEKPSPKGKIQTGPGVPDWTSRSAQLEWQGPLLPDETFRISLIPPWMNILLTLVRLAALIWLVGLLCEIRWQSLPWRKGGGVAAALVALGLSSLDAQSQDVPRADILDDLRRRLLARSDCYPDCAILEEASLKVEGERLTLAIQAHLVEQVAIPLPGEPEQVDVLQQEDNLLHEGGALWAVISPGIHTVVCSYSLAGRDVFQLRFPLVPKRMTAQHAGWELSGLTSDGTLGEQIQLKRITQTEERAPSESGDDLINPHLELRREVTFGTTWSMTTTLIRRNGAAVVLEVPLQPGEQVVSGHRVENGKIQIHLPEGNEEGKFVWQSTVKPVSPWVWTAPTNVPWTEEWLIRPTDLWNVRWSGPETTMPVITHFQEEDPALAPSWRPRAGEQLTMIATEPVGMEGPTLTFKSVSLTATPGNRVTDYVLELQVRSSIGGEHGISLPADAEIKSHVMDEQELPIRLEKGKLILSLAPAENVHVVRFSVPSGLSITQTAASINLEHDAVNIRTRMELPPSRWLLWVSGPKMGPALMFWPILLVLILVCFGLGRALPVSLRTHQWLLLGLGVSQLHILAGLVVVLWFAAFTYRGKMSVETMRKRRFGMFQLFLIFLTMAFFGVMVSTLYSGMLGQPNMYASFTYDLNWYQDRIKGLTPSVLVISLPMWVYRVVMLLWSLWMANSMLRWIREAWAEFSHNGLWIQPKPKPEAPEVPSEPEVVVETEAPRNEEQPPLPETDPSEPPIRNA